MPRYMTFGKVMLRLKAPQNECFFQSSSLEATFGSGESKVAVSLSNFGLVAGIVFVLPNNGIAEA